MDDRARLNSKAGTGSDRVAAFMAKNGLGTMSELAQVFRVAQSTWTKWLRDLKLKPIDEVLPGPAMILLELMEQGIETSDLAAMRRIAALRAAPESAEPMEGEGGWRIELPTKRRQGARVISKGGHFIVVHGLWIRQRVACLEGSADAPTKEGGQVMRMLKKYRQAAQDLDAMLRD